MKKLSVATILSVVLFATQLVHLNASAGLPMPLLPSDNGEGPSSVCIGWMGCWPTFHWC